GGTRSCDKPLPAAGTRSVRRLRHILESVPSRILVAALTAKPPAAWLRLRAGTSQLDSWMSALGHKRTLERFRPMFAIPPKADISRREMNVRFVPKADSGATTRSPH